MREANSAPVESRLREVGQRGGEGRGGQDPSPSEIAHHPRRPWPPALRMALLAVGLLLLLASGLLLIEIRTSGLQSYLLAAWAGEISFQVEEGPNPDFRVPVAGPYDLRLGHARLPEMVGRLEERGFRVESQARTSPRFDRVVELGLFPIYREKTRAGLRLTDRQGRELYRASYPERVYPDFSSIPPPIRETLLFIENRKLLDERFPRRNPAVEWDRLAGSVAHLALRGVGAGEGSVAGASTLATQIEKFRHSPGGRTGTPRDKLVQMASASLRAYARGPETLETRRRIVLDYLNSVPLSAVPGYGEVTGLQDGLWAWFGMDPDEVNQRLRVDPGSGPAAGVEGSPAGQRGAAEEGARTASEEELAAAGRAYRAALSLMIAQRRPSFYLARVDGQAALHRLGDLYLGLLVEHGVISPELHDAARDAEVPIRPRPPAPPDRVSFVERKAATSARTHLLGALGVSRLYELDRYDLSARATIDSAAQDAVTRRLLRLQDRSYVREAGLDAFRLLGQGDPAGIVYSFLLYERGPDGNRIRIQTDNFDGPFDLNQAARLELGSTAKLRALVSYLEIVHRLHGELAPLSREERRAALDSLPDPLTAWAVRYLDARPDATLRDMLGAAMERTYSAGTRERFFTGGGQHTFQNFDRAHDGQVFTVRTAFRHSVNLPFIRLMRDVERWYALRVPGSSARILQDPSDPARAVFLQRFADREGRQFVNRFHTKFQGKAREEILDALAAGRRLGPQRLAWAFRAADPDADPTELAAFLGRHSPAARFSAEAVEDLFRRSDAEALSWADRGYLASIHPLELWVARYLIGNPGATRLEVIEASADVRQEVYGWLFSGRRRAAQDRRIATMLEVEAFLGIARDWQRLGYPFENLVPSFGTAIGSSGDRPGALAELAGILLADGVRLPTVRLESLRFAAGTPYETSMRAAPPAGERVLSPEVAAVAREALLDVVERGTARGVQGAVRDGEGRPLPIGGKTGTGDNQFRVFGPGGRLLESRTVNRTATLVFTIGDRFFGVVTAHVPGAAADEYRFTSALPVQILRLLAPDLEPLIRERPAGAAEDPQSGGGVASGA